MKHRPCLQVSFAAALLAMASLVAGACGDPTPVSTSPFTATAEADAPTAIAEPTSTRAPSTAASTTIPAMHAPPPRTTGIAAIDAAIAAAVAGDADALWPSIRYTRQPCVLPPDRIDLDPRPPCRDGEVTGDLVDAFFQASCEGGFTRADDHDDIRRILESRIDQPRNFLGIYASHGVWSVRERYSAVFYEPGVSPRVGRATVEIFNDEGLIGLANGCSASPMELVEHWALFGVK